VTKSEKREKRFMAGFFKQVNYMFYVGIDFNFILMGFNFGYGFNGIYL